MEDEVVESVGNSLEHNQKVCQDGFCTFSTLGSRHAPNAVLISTTEISHNYH